MSDARQHVVSSQLDARVIDPNGITRRTKLGLHYDCDDDPFAVHIIVPTNLLRGAGLQTWLCDRDLMVKGLKKHQGIGNVRVSPWSSAPTQFIFLALHTSRDITQLKVPRRRLSRFLQRTRRLTLSKQEIEAMIDTCTTRLLAGK